MGRRPQEVYTDWRGIDGKDSPVADRYQPLRVENMEAEGSASTTPTASSPAPNGSTPGTPGTPETSSTMTQKEILRERYLKGVKKRKCAVCGNTARARSSNPSLKALSHCAAPYSFKLCATSLLISHSFFHCLTTAF